MSVEAALGELWKQLNDLRETVVALRLHAVDDVPIRGRTSFSDKLGDEIEDMAASLLEVFNVVGATLATADDVKAVRATVEAAHEQVGRARHTYWVALGQRDAQLELDRLRRRGGRWEAWVDTIRKGAEPAPDQLADADAAVRLSWRELIEKAAASPVHVQTTAIGQQVTFPASERARAPLG